MLARLPRLPTETRSGLTPPSKIGYLFTRGKIVRQFRIRTQVRKHQPSDGSMSNPTSLPKFPSARSLARATVLLCLAAQVGCRNAAYSDLYVESMAAEIRQLEDQLYEYDNEYHVLEKELASLKAENQKLRTNPATTTKPQSGLGQLLAPKESTPSTLEFAPREPLPVPSTTNSLPTEQLPAKKPESILEPPGAANS